MIVHHETGWKETRRRERTGKVSRGDDFVLGLVPEKPGGRAFYEEGLVWGKG